MLLQTMRKDEKSISEYRSCPLKSEHFTISLHMDLGYTSSEIMSNPNVSFSALDSTWPSTPKSHKNYKKWCFFPEAGLHLYHLREKIAELISTALIIILIIFLLFPWSSSILPIPARLDGLFIPPGTRSRHLDRGTMRQPTFYTTENGRMSLQEGPFSRGNESEPIIFQGICYFWGECTSVFSITISHLKKTTQMPSSSE